MPTRDVDRIERADQLIVPKLRRWAIPALRIALAIVFVWFGALKVLGVSPVSEMVASTVYFVDPDWFVPVLGVVEVGVGIGLAFRIWMRLVLALLILQMLGTFLVLVVLPDLAFQDSNPLLLTTEGEFVLKNLVILGSGLVVGSQVDEPEEEIPSSSETSEPADQGPAR